MSFWIRSSLFICLVGIIGASSCDKKPNAYKCVTFEDKGEIQLRCRNSATKESFTSDLSILGKCIKNQEMKCSWILTDELEFEKARLFYEREYEKK
jgi:hypothetical protein